MLQKKALSFSFSSIVESNRQSQIFSSVAAELTRRASSVTKQQPATAGVYQFAKLVGDLKRVKRAGWLQHKGIQDVESVADHSWRMSILCLMFSRDSQIDITRCMKIAIIHDLAEIIVGDLTPKDGVSEHEKFVLEEDGIKQLLSALPDKQLQLELYNLWRDFEDRECPESKLVKDIDKYELLLQAFEYEQQYPEVDLSEFFNHNVGKINNHPQVALWTQELIALRNAHIKNKKY